MNLVLNFKGGLSDNKLYPVTHLSEVSREHVGSEKEGILTLGNSTGWKMRPVMNYVNHLICNRDYKRENCCLCDT